MSSRPTLRRALAPAACAVALFGAACSSGGSDEDDAAAYCAATAGLADLESLLTPESIREPDRLEAAFVSFRDDLAEIESEAPSEIRDDIGTLGGAVDDVLSTLETVGFDITQLDESSAAALLAPFERTAVATAAERIQAYDTLNCGDESVDATAAEPPDADATTVPEADPAEVNRPSVAEEYAELIRTTFTDEEIEATLAFAEVTGINELVDAIVAGDVTVDEIDQFLQRRSDGVPFALGDDPELDILWRACESEDWAACDGLFEGAPLESLYQRFAATCGQALEDPAGGRCVELLDA